MTLEKESGTSAPVFRRRNDLHWVALLEFVANSSVKQIGSGTNSVPRRENVCLMARESSALRNGPVRDSTQMSKILHAAVEFAQLHHCLELLGDHSFAIVGVKLRGGISKNCRVNDGRGFRRDDVAETDVDLHRETCIAKHCPKSGANSLHNRRPP